MEDKFKEVTKAGLALVGYILVVSSVVYFLSGTNHHVANELALITLVGGIIFFYPYSLFVNRFVFR